MFERLRKRKPERPDWGLRIREGFAALQFYLYTFLVVLLLGLGFVYPRMFITVPSGHHAVMWRFFEDGTVTDEVWGEGFHVIPPWDKLTIYESRLQERRLELSVLSDEGLDLSIVVAVRYRPRYKSLGFLHQDIGPEYFERLLQPEVEAHVRRTFGSRPAHEIYASSKDVLQELRNIPMIARIDAGEGEGLQSELGYIEVEEIKLVDIDLPEIVKAAIADKYRQEQLMLEYKYKLRREEQEAERKRIEAAGIRDYNSIAEHISPDLLRWRDIEATRALAEAPSSKVVLLGAGSDQQVPLLFGLGESPGKTPAPAVPEPPADEAEAEAEAETEQ